MKNKKFSIFLILSLFGLGYFYGCSNNSTNPLSSSSQVNVSGKVLDPYGAPVSSASVVIQGKSASVAADGSFAINNVSTPYDAYVLSPTLGVFGVTGLTISNPSLPCGYQTGEISGFNVTVPTIPAGSYTMVVYQDTITGKISGEGIFASGVSNGNINVGCNGGQYSAGKLYFLEYTESGGVVTSYAGYSEQRISCMMGMGQHFTCSHFDIIPGQSTVSGTVNSSGGSNLAARLCLNFGYENNLNHIGAGIETVSGSAFNFNVPTGTSTNVQCNIVAYTNSPTFCTRMKTVTAGSSGNVINLDTIPDLLTPPNNALNVDTTTVFSFSNGGGNGIHFIRLTPPISNGSFFQIITRGTSVKIPNFAMYGYTLGSASAYTWYDSKSLDISSTDDYCMHLSHLNAGILGRCQSMQFMFTSR